MSDFPQPHQTEVWLVRFGASEPGEPGKNRPAVVVSSDEFLTGSEFDLISVVPLTTARVPTVLRPRVPEGNGVARDCVAVCAGVRGMVRARFLQRLGQVDNDTFAAIAHARRMIEWWDDPREQGEGVF